MPRFVVTTREVHVCSYGVNADTEEEAIKKVQEDNDADIVPDSLAYMQTLSPGEGYTCEAWDVQQETPAP